MSHRIRSLVLGGALAVALAGLAAAQGSTGAIIGLIGTVTHATRELDLRLTEAQGAGNRTWADLQPAFEPLLARHLEIAASLRTAWGLMSSAPGYDPTERVAGMPAGSVRSLDPVGFYSSAARAHQAMNDRLRGLLDLYAEEIPAADADRYREDLERALSMAVVPRR